MNAPRWRAALAGIATVAAGVVAAATAFAAAAIELPPGRSHVEVPFDVLDHRVFVDATIEGRGPFRFVFDTGGANVLDHAVAESLGLVLRDRFEMTGAGDGSLPAWWTTVTRADVGGVSIRDHDFAVFSLQPIRDAIGFERLDGLIGREVLERFPVGLDFERGVMRVALDRSAFAPPESARTLPLEFIRNHMPRVAGVLAGIPATFALDTGDRSALTLFGPFVTQHGLRDRWPRSERRVTGWGVGGAILADLARVPRVELGGFGVRAIEARLPLAKGGAFASSDASASLGTRFLSRFHLVFDYRARELVLWPNARFAAPDRSDRSGAFLVRDSLGWRVRSVSPGTPAALAGLREGDLVVRVDGRDTRESSLLDQRECWAADTAVTTRLVVHHGTLPRAVVLRLPAARGQRGVERPSPAGSSMSSKKNAASSARPASPDLR